MSPKRRLRLDDMNAGSAEGGHLIRGGKDVGYEGFDLGDWAD